MKDVSKPGYLGFEVIGIYKLITGALALAVAIGVFRYLDHDPGPRAERIVTHLGLDPHNQIIHAALSRVTGIDRTHFRALEVGTYVYALIRLIEGIGLIRGRLWAGYLVVIATSSLMPFEIYEIASKPGPLRIAIFVLNASIVIYLIIALRKEHQVRGRRSA
jgi:uncharacterized membrane protein (DUF2068 family)